MLGTDSSIRPIRFSDVATITRMAYDNMNGNDRQFTKLMANPLSRWASYLTLPFYFLWAGDGYKFILDGRIAGCAYLHLQPNSGYIFNVNVNGPYRRQGVAKDLMIQLEQVTVRNGRRWTSLQVDTDNLAARNLYEKIGYRPYNASFLRLELQFPSLEKPFPSLETPFLTGEIEPGKARLERLRPYSGRNLLGRYLAHEKVNGESIDAAVIDDYGSIKLSGDFYWRCVLSGQEIGVIVRSGPEKSPVFHIAFDQSAWGQSSLPGIINLLISKLPDQAQRVDLAFGSSGHYQSAKETLADFGFEEQYQARMLMFKSLNRENAIV